MDSQRFNRVEYEAGQWRSREERLARMFSASLYSRPFLSEKLAYFDRIAAKYGGTDDPDEKFSLRVLKQERREIERKLYPNVLLRMVRRMLVVPFRNEISARQQARLSQENILALQAQLESAGFLGISAKLKEAIGQGNPNIPISLSYYVEPTIRMDFDLSLSRDSQGSIRLEGYKAYLYNEAKPGERREQFFSAAKGKCIDTKSSLNLLQGRAVEQDGNWIQLDFNDRDAKGQYRTKEFPAAYGFDIEKQIRSLPIKELLDQKETSKLVAALKSGSCHAVSFIRDGKERRYYIEANPQFKSVNIYDEHSRKITVGTAMGNKTMETLSLAHKSGKHEEQAKEKRTRMRIS